MILSTDLNYRYNESRSKFVLEKNFHNIKVSKEKCSTNESKVQQTVQ